MAQTGIVNSLFGDLITTILPKSGETTPKRIKQLKDNAARAIKTHQYIRTNQFEVDSTLEGLIEKFSIVNRDDLSIAISSRLDELRHLSRSKFTPEILSLLISLSDRPDRKNSLETLHLLHPPSPDIAVITWEELQAEEPLTGELWLNERYSTASEDEAESRDEDSTSFELLTDVTSLPQASGTILPLLRLPSTAGTPNRQSQFWRKSNWKDTRPQQLSELQVVREILHMLHGLETSIFSIDTENELVYYAMNVCIHDISIAGLNEALQSISNIGSDIYLLRTYSEKPCPAPLWQAFRSAVFDCVLGFDQAIATIESRYMPGESNTIISLLHLRYELECLSRPFVALRALVRELSDTGNAFVCLEVMYDQLCSLQAEGDSECYIMLGQIFFRCLNIYLRPVSSWMQDGVIDDNDECFFITVADKGTSLHSLWHDRYILRTTADGALYAPRFLHASAQNILNTGKSIVFLQELGKGHRKDSRSPQTNFNIELVCGSNDIVPFALLFATAFEDWINANYGPASGLLTQQLRELCGLGRILQSLQHVFLSKNGVLFQIFADELFKRLDTQDTRWDDKFLLSEIARHAFASPNGIQERDLSVRIDSAKLSGRNDRRSLSALSSVLLDVNLSWAIQNIIPKAALGTYQRILILLLQVYRVKRILQDSCLLSSRARVSCKSSRSIFSLRHRLLWFSNIVHDYITGIVAGPAMATLMERMEDAVDVDEMCAIHTSFITTLQKQALLESNLAPISDSVHGILSLAEAFGSAGGELLKIAVKDIGREQKRRKRLSRTKAPSDSSDESEATLSDGSDAENPRTVAQMPHETDHLTQEERCQKLHDQFDQLLRFVIAGLRGVSRAGGELAWEMLAERLEWDSMKKPRRWESG